MFQNISTNTSVRVKSRRSMILAPIAALLLGVTVFSAPVLAADSVDEAAAKKEGNVIWYTSTPVKEAQEIANLFETKTGIKVELFRSGGSAILRRFSQEIEAGKVATDVLTHSDPAAAAQMASKGLFVAFKPVGFDKLPAAAKDANGYFAAQRLNVMTIYLRADKVPEADRPKTWTDLLNPKYKGKMVMADPSFTSLQVSVVGMMSKERGWSYYEGLRKNDIMIVRGNQQVSDMIKKGERLIAVGALDSYAAADREAGHDVVTLYPADGVFVIPSPTSVVKGSPHPNAAKLFATFMLTKEVQEIFPKSGGYAARSDVAAPKGSPDFNSLKVIDVDYNYIQAQGNNIKKKFNEALQ
ncbi:MAG: extracellular solute-binding protein [Polaromonas sp.]|nr:extracellular solute-binding protein [Polaromonas sp.]